MTRQEIINAIQLLRNTYARDGQPHVLNDAQWAVYLAKFAPFTLDAFTRAADRWIEQSKYFPAVSDLLALLRPPEIDLKAAAHIAFGVVEKAVREAGAYRSVTFAQGSIGETVRQVFGTWQRACAFDLDSPGWAIRRQSFLAIFPDNARQDFGEVTLDGLHGHIPPLMIGAVAGVPMPSLNPPDNPRFSRDEAKATLAELRKAWEAKKQLGSGAKKAAS